MWLVATIVDRAGLNDVIGFQELATNYFFNSFGLCPVPHLEGEIQKEKEWIKVIYHAFSTCAFYEVHPG